MAITIDGYDIFAQWTLTPVYDNFHSALMKDAGVKDRISVDPQFDNGLKVQQSTGYTKSREVTINFFCNTFANYEAFLIYCVTQKVVNLYVPKMNETLRLEYRDCSSFNDYREYNTFAVRFREADPTNRTNV